MKTNVFYDIPRMIILDLTSIIKSSTASSPHLSATPPLVIPAMYIPGRRRELRSVVLVEEMDTFIRPSFLFTLLLSRFFRNPTTELPGS